jgi:photosystem II stability/assembly factor-like uncharacterized protein
MRGRRVGLGIGGLALMLVALLASSLAAGAAPASVVHPPLTPEQLLQAEAQWFQLSHFGTKATPLDGYSKALAEAARIPRGPTTALANTGTWRPLGPQPISSGGTLYSGRLTAVAVSPTDSRNIWIGGADGGVWNSIDGGAWTPKFDGEPTLAIGSIAIDPHSANTIYVGTGESNQSGDSYWGEGIFKSTNGGSTWTQLGGTIFPGATIGQLAVDPNNSLDILAAVEINLGSLPPNSPTKMSPNSSGHSRSGLPMCRVASPGAACTSGSILSRAGIWESTNGGTSWTQVLADGSSVDGGEPPDAGTDLVWDPHNSGVAYAVMGNEFDGGTTSYTSIAGVYKSINSGSTWTQLKSGLPTGNNIFRGSIGISHDGSTLYTIFANAATSGGTFGAVLNSDVYVSTNSGSSWTAHTVPADMASDHSEDQWWYDIYSQVDPTNKATAYIGGVDVWQTTSTGKTWTNITKVYTGGTVHPDQHALAFQSSTSSSYYFGNDGGVWSGTSGGSFTNLNSGLNLTQFYGGSLGDVGSDAQLYGGAQDNGESQYPISACSTCRSPTAQWNEVFGGDGGDTVVDYSNNATVYEEYVFGQINKSTDGGVHWSPATTGISTADPVNFIMPYIMSPNSHTELFAGTDRLYRTTSSASSWSPYSPNQDGSTPVSAVAVAPGHDGDVYYGDNLGNIYATTTGGSTWAKVTPTGTTGGLVTGLAVDPTNPLVVWATYADFASASGEHLFRSTNGGTSWTDMSLALPNIPFESVLVFPVNHNEIVVGTDVGLFYTNNSGTNWYQVGVGLPNVAIDQIFTPRDASGLYVATHGRGMWELSGHLISSPTSFSLSGSPNPAPQTLNLSNKGFGVLTWGLTSTLPSWLTVSVHSGTLEPQKGTALTLTFNMPTTPGTYQTTLVFTAGRADNSTISVPVTVTVS